MFCSISSRVLPVEMQPGKSGEYAENPVCVVSITIKYFFISSIRPRKMKNEANSPDRRECEEREQRWDKGRIVEARRRPQVGAEDQFHHKQQKREQRATEPRHLRTQERNRILAPLRTQPKLLIRQIDRRSWHRRNQPWNPKLNDRRQDNDDHLDAQKRRFRLPRTGQAARSEVRPHNMRQALRVIVQLHRSHHDQQNENGVGQARITHEGLFLSAYLRRVPEASVAWRVVPKRFLSNYRCGTRLPLA